MISVAAGSTGEAAAIRMEEADFESWVRSEQRRVFRLCYRLLGDRDEADSAAQDAFVKAYKAFGRLGADMPQDRAAWLTRVTINACLDRLRSRRWRFWRRRVNPEDEPAILASKADLAPSPEDQLFSRQVARRLAASLGKLSERQRTVFALRHFEDRSLEEIGALLGLDTGTVKAHLSRALAKLRLELQDLYFAGRAAGRE